MAALKGPADAGVERGLVAAGVAFAVPVGCGPSASVGAGGGSVGAGFVAAGAAVFAGGTAVGGCVGGALVGLVSGAIVGAAGCGLPQAANAINISNVRISRNFIVGSPLKVLGAVRFRQARNFHNAQFPKKDDNEFGVATI